jgi:hypothetical protein
MAYYGIHAAPIKCGRMEEIFRFGINARIWAGQVACTI